MKSKFLIILILLISAPAYAQLGPAGNSLPANRSEAPREAVPTMPQGAIPRPIGPMNSGVPQPPSGSAGGNGGLLIGNGGNGRVAKPDAATGVVKPTPAQLKPAAAPKEEAPVIIAPAPIVENSSSKPRGK